MYGNNVKDWVTRRSEASRTEERSTTIIVISYINKIDFGNIK